MAWVLRKASLSNFQRDESPLALLGEDKARLPRRLRELCSQAQPAYRHSQGQRLVRERSRASSQARASSSVVKMLLTKPLLAATITPYLCGSIISARAIIARRRRPFASSAHATAAKNRWNVTAGDRYRRSRSANPNDR